MEKENACDPTGRLPPRCPAYHRVVIDGPRVLKATHTNEAAWTLWFAPEHVISYGEGQLTLHFIAGVPLSACLAVEPAWVVNAAHRLGALHRRGLTFCGHLPAVDLGASLGATWQAYEGKLSAVERQLPDHWGDLITRMRAVPQEGVYLDANPGNWIVTPQNEVVKIDYGHVARASFASDLAQLLDHQPVAEAVRQAAFVAWRTGLGEPPLAKQALGEFATVRIFSCLKRAPFHPWAKRLKWYSQAISWCDHLALDALSTALQRVVSTGFDVSTC